MTSFAPGTRHALLAALMQLEAQLRALAQAADRATLAAPLTTLHDDLDTEQQRLLADGARQLRAAMDELVRHHHLVVPEPAGSAVQACLRALHAAQAAVETLTQPAAGGAPVSDEAQADLHRIAAQLLAPLDAMRDALEPPADAMGTVGDADLRALLRMVRTHELAQFARRAQALAAYAGAPEFTVAVFGHTNAGKSSLINQVLATDLLPTGATPITTVPIRLGWAAAERATVHFAHAPPQAVSRDRLIELATERYNSDNRKLVAWLACDWPAPLLAEGVCVWDTPGGMADDVLPPCDLALVLIDASSDLALQEAALVAALQQAGSAVLVLLNKADRLNEQDRWGVLGHVSAQLHLGPDSATQIFLVSTVADDAQLRRGWLQRGLRPWMQRRAALRATSLQKKKALLRRAIARALERRAAALPSAAASAQMAATQRAGEQLIASARVQPPTLPAAAELVGALLREVAHNAAALDEHGAAGGIALSPLVAASLQARVGTLHTDLVRALELLAGRCEDAVAGAGVGVLRWQAPVAALPALETAALPAALTVARPWVAGFGPWALRLVLRRTLRRHLRAPLEGLLEQHGAALQHWRQAALDDLEQAFSAACAERRDASAQLAADLQWLRAEAPPPAPEAAATAHEP